MTDAKEKAKDSTCSICGCLFKKGRAGVCAGCIGKAGEGLWHRGSNPMEDKLRIKPGCIVRIVNTIREDLNGLKAKVLAVVKGGASKQRGFCILEGFGKRRFTWDELTLIEGVDDDGEEENGTVG